MERICPYLALADDGRTVVDGFDSKHQCHALSPPSLLERSRQVQLCLTEAHTRCERFAAARTAWLAASSGLPRVAPDVAFGRTRLILEPEPAWRNLAGAPAARISRRTTLIAVAAAAVLTLFALGGLFGMFGKRPAPDSGQTPSASASSIATPTATPASSSDTASPSIEPTATPTPAPSPTPAATPTPAPTPRTYVVKSGDTLNGIAQSFGTTANAIAVANGITVTDTISPGDVLIIP